MCVCDSHQDQETLAAVIRDRMKKLFFPTRMSYIFTPHSGGFTLTGAPVQPRAPAQLGGGGGNKRGVIRSGAEGAVLTS